MKNREHAILSSKVLLSSALKLLSEAVEHGELSQECRRAIKVISIECDCLDVEIEG